MIARKLWMGDLLNLAAGNSFFADEVVTHRAGYCIVSRNCEEGDPLVEIDGGSYIVKRADLSELTPAQSQEAHAYARVLYRALNG